MIVSGNKKILKNTIMLYFRQILTLIVGLYTVRVVLDVLGVENYGIYTVIGGVVLFFSFLKGSMTSASQRFFSFAIGENNPLRLNKVFSVNLVIYILLGLLALTLLELGGLWFVKEHLKIPPERVESAILLYHLSVLTFFFTIFSTPFTSAIIAHEDMEIYAYLSIIEVTMKLGVVFLLQYLDGDKLVLYGELLLLVSIIVCSMYALICFKKYKECQIRKFYWDKALFFEIIGFTGWTLFGQFTSASRNQAVTILLNQFFNPVVVAANAIAKNIAAQTQMFSVNFNSSLYPPIIKSYAAKDLKTMFTLIFNGCKIAFFLMWILALPIILEMEFLLGLWLKEVPDFAVLFSRLSLVEVLIASISLPIAAAARAPGRMKYYELILGSIQVGVFLVSWYVLSHNAPAKAVYIVAIIANISMFIIRLIIVNNLISIPIKSFFYKVCLPILGVVFVSGILSFGVHFLLPNSIIFSFLSIVLSVLVIFGSIYFIGLDEIWREKLKTMILSKIGLRKTPNNT